MSVYHQKYSKNGYVIQTYFTTKSFNNNQCIFCFLLHISDHHIIQFTVKCIKSFLFHQNIVINRLEVILRKKKILNIHSKIRSESNKAESYLILYTNNVMILLYISIHNIDYNFIIILR